MLNVDQSLCELLPISPGSSSRFTRQTKEDLGGEVALSGQAYQDVTDGAFIACARAWHPCFYAVAQYSIRASGRAFFQLKHDRKQHVIIYFGCDPIEDSFCYCYH